MRKTPQWLKAERGRPAVLQWDHVARTPTWIKMGFFMTSYELKAFRREERERLRREEREWHDPELLEKRLAEQRAAEIAALESVVVEEKTPVEVVLSPKKSFWTCRMQ